MHHVAQLAWHVDSMTYQLTLQGPGCSTLARRHRAPQLEHLAATPRTADGHMCGNTRRECCAKPCDSSSHAKLPSARSCCLALTSAPARAVRIARGSAAPARTQRGCGLRCSRSLSRQHAAPERRRELAAPARTQRGLALGTRAHFGGSTRRRNCARCCSSGSHAVWPIG
jgi:hypothetical protein